MKRIIYLMMALICAASANVISAQVRIGNNTEPHKGAVLDLQSTETTGKGVLLPRVSLTSLTVFAPVAGTATEGMLVYNIGDAVDKGLYVWDGSSWSKVSGGSSGNGDTDNPGNIEGESSLPTVVFPAAGGIAVITLSSDCATSGNWTVSLVSGSATLSGINSSTGPGTFTLTYKANPTSSYLSSVVKVTDPCGNSRTLTYYQAPGETDGTSYENGTGHFTGRMVFDVALGTSNDGKNNCGKLTDRASRKTDFSNRTEQGVGASAPYSGVQVYTFTPSGTVYNLRFIYVEEGMAYGHIIESIEPKGDYTANVFGEAQVVVKFKSSLNTLLGGVTRKNALKASLYAIYNNGLMGSGEDISVRLQLSFQDCTACGAQTSNGWLDMMCFNLGADEVNGEAFTYSTYILGDHYQWGRRADGHEKRTSATIAGPVAVANLDGNGQVASDKTQYGTFVTTTADPHNWRTQADNLWGADKKVSDPCPAGWILPTSAQWVDIRNKNTWTSDGASGYTVGDALYLPVGGHRNTKGNISSMSGISAGGFYWSSTVYTTDSYYLHFNSTSITPRSNYGRSYGMSVRCVAETN